MAIDLTLRPMSTSQVLDRTFSLYRQNFLVFAGIAALPPGLLLLGQFLIFLVMNPFSRGSIGNDPTFAMAKIGFAGVGFLGLLALSLLGYVFASGATVYAVSRVHLGHPITIAEAYRLILPSFGNILGIFVLVGLAIGGVVAVGGTVFAVPMVLTFAGAFANRGFTPLTGVLAMVGGLVFLAAIIVAIYLYAKLSLSIPVCVLERQGALNSMRRSWHLTTGTVWRILLITLLAIVMSTVLSWVLSIPYFVGIALMFSRKNPAMLFPFVMWQYVAQFLARTLSSPIAAIASVLIYYDQRVRKEAFDIQLMMEAIGLQAPLETFGAPAPRPG